MCRMVGPYPACRRNHTAGPRSIGVRMPDLGEALRATAAVLTGGFAVAGAANAIADPNTGSPAEMNTLAGSLSKGYDLNNCAALNLTTGQLAALACGHNPDPAGPAQ